MDYVYDSVLSAMSKLEKHPEVFGKGCSLFWRLALEAKGREWLKACKKLNDFELNQKRKKKMPSNSSLTTNKQPKQTKKLTTKHGCQLTESIVRYHSDAFLAITVLMKRLK